jgi:hypothetical protein
LTKYKQQKFQQKQLPMSIFTFLYVALVHDAFALLKEIDPEKILDMTEFKCKFAAQLVVVCIQSKKKRELQLKTVIRKDDMGA